MVFDSFAKLYFKLFSVVSEPKTISGNVLKEVLQVNEMICMLALILKPGKKCEIQ